VLLFVKWEISLLGRDGEGRLKGVAALSRSSSPLRDKVSLSENNASIIVSHFLFTVVILNFIPPRTKYWWVRGRSGACGWFHVLSISLQRHHRHVGCLFEMTHSLIKCPFLTIGRGLGEPPEYNKENKT